MSDILFSFFLSDKKNMISFLVIKDFKCSNSFIPLSLIQLNHLTVFELGGSLTYGNSKVMHQQEKNQSFLDNMTILIEH